MDTTTLRQSLRSLADKTREQATDKLQSIRGFINAASWEVATAARDAVEGDLEPDQVRDLQESIADMLTQGLWKVTTDLEQQAEEADESALGSYADYRNDIAREDRAA